ncbi:MAG: DUF1295 domain-containing protein [Treponema sp.]|nr:DUF1295 domain-containing protein [Treponema sp.]
MKRFILFVFTGLFFSAVIVLPFAGGVSQFVSFITSANALLVVALWAAGFALASFLFGLVTKDYSWVDRSWSTLPVAFVWYYACRGGCTLPLCVTAALVTLWGARLTFNFARKGGYSGVEDYRWSILRTRIKNPFLWQLFNLLFISCYQTGMFVLFTWPVYSITGYAGKGIPVLFWACIVLAFALLYFETTADQQQWNFHAAKKASAKGNNFPPRYSADVKNGFLSQGLFALSRHPNYFGELGFWWTIWLAALSLGGDPVLSGFFGPLMLTVLFVGSTIFTENISASKYPEYRNYKKRVSPVIPWFKRHINPH